MRTMTIAVLVTFVAACQSAQTDGTPAPGGGSTTYARGTPDTTSDTTRVSRDVPSQQGGATLTLDRTSYSAGATATMRITSQTTDTLGYNPCANRVVERQARSSWVAHPEPNRMCTMELRLLMPNQTVTNATDLPADLRSGTYRMVLSLSRQSTTNQGTVRAVSPTFTVN